MPLCPALIGRDDPVALAGCRLKAVLGVSGSGHLLFLAGEAGTGRTRLLAEVCDRAAAEEHLPEAWRLGEQMSERQRLSPGATGPRGAGTPQWTDGGRGLLV